MTTEVGLREAKKQRTRDHIAEVATRLFMAQGFEATTIAQIAREAGVAKMTVTNYFAIKEDLLFDQAPELVRWPADAVASRAAGVAPLAAVRDEYRRRFDQRWAALSLSGYDFWRLVDTSPVLQARERQIFAEQEEALAAVLVAEAEAADAADPDAAVRARVRAARVAGVVRVLFAEARRRVLDGDDVETVATAMRRASSVAFDDAERAAG